MRIKIVCTKCHNVHNPDIAMQYDIPIKDIDNHIVEDFYCNKCNDHTEHLLARDE